MPLIYSASIAQSQISSGPLIGIAAITGAVICAIHGAQLAGAFIGAAGVTGLVTAFILGRTMLMKQMQMEFKQQQAVREAQLKELKDTTSTPRR